MPSSCIIFDLDGTLVDSEGLCNQAFLDLLPDLDDTLDSLIERYRGNQLALILNDLQARLGRRLPADFEATYRARVSALFSTRLRPTPGTVEMLDELTNSRCVASSGPPEKINHALSVSGLSGYFGDRLFSSYQVGSWKPEPGLFLYAARSMGYRPSQCIVVEDSPVGIQAAKVAGMTALHFSPGSCSNDAGAHAVFGSMAELPRIIENLSQPA